MFDKIYHHPLADLLPPVQGKYIFNEPLKKHTWFGVGGPADVMFLPKDDRDLAEFLQKKPTNLPVFLIGGGSNLLVRDGGIRGVVIKLDTPFFRKITLAENTLTIGAGLRTIELQKFLLKEKIGGLEFLCSIPGTFGGLVRTNAGCFKKSLSDVLISTAVMDGNGTVREVPASELNLSYRSSLFPDDWIITAVTLKKELGNEEDILKTLTEQKAYRLAHQPYNEKTGGSTFKNPTALSAWQLIKKAGCDQLSVGGAKVSDKHCNFLINTGTASAEDIETLGDMIVEKVYEQTSVTLEWEIKKTGVRK